MRRSREPAPGCCPPSGPGRYLLINRGGEHGVGGHGGRRAARAADAWRRTRGPVRYGESMLQRIVTNRQAQQGEEHGSSQPSDEQPAHEPSEITYDEQFYPARPAGLRLRPRLRGLVRAALASARTASRPATTRPTCRGWSSSRCWPTPTRSPAVLRPGQHVAEPVRQPRPAGRDREGVGLVHRVPDLDDHQARRRRSSARWATRTCGRRSRRSASTAVHTGPVKRAGGIVGWEPTPSVDGHFDRISTQIDDGVRHRGGVPDDVRGRRRRTAAR